MHDICCRDAEPRPGPDAVRHKEAVPDRGDDRSRARSRGRSDRPPDSHRDRDRERDRDRDRDRDAHRDREREHRDRERDRDRDRGVDKSRLEAARSRHEDRSRDGDRPRSNLRCGTGPQHPTSLSTICCWLVPPSLHWPQHKAQQCFMSPKGLHHALMAVACMHAGTAHQSAQGTGTGLSPRGTEPGARGAQGPETRSPGHATPPTVQQTPFHRRPVSKWSGLGGAAAEVPLYRLAALAACCQCAWLQNHLHAVIAAAQLACITLLSCCMHVQGGAGQPEERQVRAGRLPWTRCATRGGRAPRAALLGGVWGVLSPDRAGPHAAQAQPCENCASCCCAHGGPSANHHEL